ncbi:MAG: hypothetical protein ACLPVI_11205 [Dehalococcoidales bacterium]
MKKGFIWTVMIFLIAISMVLVSCGSSKTTTTTKTTTTSIEPIEVLSVTGPLQPANPGGPTVTITLENITALTVSSLSAVFTNIGPSQYVFNFDVTDAAPLRPMASTSATQTLINGAFNSDVLYPLTIEGSLDSGLTFNYIVQVKITVPSS